MRLDDNPACQGRRESPGPQPLASHPRLVGEITAAAVIFAFWLVISASLAPADLLLGACLSMVLGWWSACYLWASDAPRLTLRQLLALLFFLLRLAGRVFQAALHVAGLVVDPRLPVRPHLVVCRTRLRGRASRVAFALSVTLTPGTLTVDVDGDAFLVHCLDDLSAERLLQGDLERRVAAVFEREGAS